MLSIQNIFVCNSFAWYSGSPIFHSCTAGRSPVLKSLVCCYATYVWYDGLCITRRYETVDNWLISQGIYSDRLNKPHLEGLEARRPRYDLILTYEKYYLVTLTYKQMICFHLPIVDTAPEDIIIKYPSSSAESILNNIAFQNCASNVEQCTWRCCFNYLRKFTHFIKCFGLTEFLKV